MVANSRKKKATAILLLSNYVRNQKKRRFGTRPKNQLRFQKGDFFSLVPDLRNLDSVEQNKHRSEFICQGAIVFNS